MNAEEIFSEAVQLARATVRLSAIPSGAAPVGCYRGPAPLESPLPGQHLLSFDSTALPAPLSERAELRGTLTLHHVGDYDEGPQTVFAVLPELVDFSTRPSVMPEVVEYDHLKRERDSGRRLVWPELDEKSVLLYAHPDRCLPNPAELVARGSERLHSWLRSIGWDPAWRFNGNLTRRSPAFAEYEKLYLNDLYGPKEDPPLLWTRPKGRTFAFLGGYPLVLMDEELPAGELVVTLLEEEEPRRHVFVSSDGTFKMLNETT
jgi:hypothetical protein